MFSISFDLWLWSSVKKFYEWNENIVGWDVCEIDIHSYTLLVKMKDENFILW